MRHRVLAFAHLESRDANLSQLMLVIEQKIANDKMIVIL